MLNRNQFSRHGIDGRRNSGVRQGFTLIEMLVSVTLVMLMMLMFASVFQIAGSSMSRMRGLAENDQRARSLQSVLKADLDKRSFRWVYPFAANENTGGAGSKIGSRQGYFYISENNPYNGLDDVIQFTVMSTVVNRNTDQSPYYGQALNLNSALATYPNQPDADDGQLTPNNTGLSTVAEVAYFVRNGNLYRRQLLIREPLSIAGTNPQPSDETQQNQPGIDVFDPNPGVAPVFQYPGPSFWNDYDYSAYYQSTGGISHGALFLGSNSLDNSGTSVNAIGNPANRFGFSPANVGLTYPGLPKEFRADTGTADLADFIGRFTLLECSDPNFRYPQNLAISLAATTYIPMDPTATMTLNSSQIVTDFVHGSRRGEDLILANVHAFDIQVWDELYQGFVNIGDPALTTTSADYALGNRYSTGVGTPPSPAFGPRITENTANYATNAVFDTWHPKLDLNTANDPGTVPDPVTGQTTYDEPPYRALYLRPTDPIVASGSDGYVGYWQADHNYTVGDLVFPSGPAGTFLIAPNTTVPTKLPYGAPFFYRCVQTGTTVYPPAASAGPNDAILEPSWPQIAGVTVKDGSVVWQAVDNRKPLKAIKLQIRFFDVSSQQLRQLTIIQSLVD